MLKVAREDFLEPHFTATFDALFRLVADPDPAVHQATTFLDALMKACAPRCWLCMKTVHAHVACRPLHCVPKVLSVCRSVCALAIKALLVARCRAW